MRSLLSLVTLVALVSMAYWSTAAAQPPGGPGQGAAVSAKFDHIVQIHNEPSEYAIWDEVKLRVQAKHNASSSQTISLDAHSWYKLPFSWYQSWEIGTDSASAPPNQWTPLEANWSGENGFRILSAGQGPVENRIDSSGSWGQMVSATGCAPSPIFWEFSPAGHVRNSSCYCHLTPFASGALVNDFWITSDEAVAWHYNRFTDGISDGSEINDVQSYGSLVVQVWNPTLAQWTRLADCGDSYFVSTLQNADTLCRFEWPDYNNVPFHEGLLAFQVFLDTTDTDYWNYADPQITIKWRVVIAVSTTGGPADWTLCQNGASEERIVVIAP